MPPLGGEARVAELGPLLPHNILLEGNSWKESSVDIAIAGAASAVALFGLLAIFCSACPRLLVFQCVTTGFLHWSLAEHE